MPTWIHPTTLLAFATLEAALCAVPGPAVMSVVASTLRGGLRSGLFTATGINAANSTYFVISAAGVISALLAAHAVFIALKWCGAAYLAFLGFRALFGKPHGSEVGTGGKPQVQSAVGSVTTGLATQFANPKAIVFFAALLPQFIDPSSHVVAQMAVLGLMTLVIETAGLTTYALSAHAARKTMGGRRTAMWFERVGGIIMIGVAASVAAHS